MDNPAKKNHCVYSGRCWRGLVSGESYGGFPGATCCMQLCGQVTLFPVNPTPQTVQVGELTRSTGDSENRQISYFHNRR